KYSILHAVVEENIGKTRRDDAAEPVVVQSPGGVLAAGAAAEILPRQQDARALVARLIHDEIRIQRTPAAVLVGLALVQITRLVEQVLAKAGALDRLQELLRDDVVGIDVGAIQGHDQAVFGCEFFHIFNQLNSIVN